MTGQPKGAAYAASKVSFTVLVKSFALEYGYDGIRIGSVAPGVADTAMLRWEESEAFVTEWVRRNALCRRARQVIRR